MKIIKKRRDELKTKPKQVSTVVTNPSIMGPMFPQSQNNIEIIDKLNDISKIVTNQKPIIDVSDKTNNEDLVKANHEDLVKIITKNMNAVMAELKKDRVIQADVKRGKSGLIESLTFKSVKNDTT